MSCKSGHKGAQVNSQAWSSSDNKNPFTLKCCAHFLLEQSQQPDKVIIRAWPSTESKTGSYSHEIIWHSHVHWRDRLELKSPVVPRSPYFFFLMLEIKPRPSACVKQELHHELLKEKKKNVKKLHLTTGMSKWTGEKWPQNKEETAEAKVESERQVLANNQKTMNEERETAVRYTVPGGQVS